MKESFDSSRNAPNGQNVSKTINITKLLFGRPLEFVGPECKQENTDKISEK
jgi:hypothetical protein